MPLSHGASNTVPVLDAMLRQTIIDASCVTCVILSLLEVELACRCAVQRAIIEPKMSYRERKFAISDHNCINHLHGYNNYCL